MDNSSRHAKVIEHVMLDELIMSDVFTSFRGNNFCPLKKVISYGQDEAIL